MKHRLEERFWLREDNEPQIDTEQQASEQPETEAEKKEASANIDWEALYEKSKKEAKDDKLFWYGNPDPRLEDDDPIKLGFFRSTYKDAADRVIRVGDAIATTYTEFGWQENTNPFIPFVNLLLNKSINGLDLESLTTGDFAILIKNFEEDILDENDLIGKGDLLNYNLIYNRNFWVKTSFTDKKELLLLQHNYARQHHGNKDVGPKFANIYLKDGSQDVSKPNLLIKPGGELRELKVIKRLLNVKTKEKVTNKQVTDMAANIKEKDTALATFIYAYDLFRVIAPNSIIAANAQYKNAFDKLRSQKDCERLSNADYKSAEKLLKLTSRNYNTAQIIGLLKNLVEVARPGFLPNTEPTES